MRNPFTRRDPGPEWVPIPIGPPNGPGHIQHRHPDDLHADLGAAVGTIAALQARVLELSKARTERDEAHAALNVARVELDDLRATRDEARARSDRYRAAWKANRRSRRTAARAIGALRARNQALLTDLEEARREIARQDAARRDNIALRASHDAVVNSHRSMHAAATRHYRRRRTAARAILALRARTNTARTDSADDQAALDRTLTTMRALHDRVASLNADLDATRAELDHARTVRAKTAGGPSRPADVRVHPDVRVHVIPELRAVYAAAFEAAVHVHERGIHDWLGRNWPTLWGPLTAMANATLGVTDNSPVGQHEQIAAHARDLRSAIRNPGNHPAYHRHTAAAAPGLWGAMGRVMAAVDRLDAALIRHHHDLFAGPRRTPPAGSFTYQQGPTTPAPGITAAVIDATDDD